MPGSDTCVGYPDSAPPPTGVTQRAATVESRLDSIQAEIRTVLETLPRDAAAADALLSSELGLVSTVELLQTIMRTAHDADVRGPIRDLAVSALALRILSGREQHVVFDSAALDAAALGQAAALGEGEQILAAFPAMGGGDACLIASANRGLLEIDEGHRCCINARVLQMVIDEDLDELARLAEGSPDDPTVRASRAEAVARLERAKLAYDVLAERLQE